MIEFHDPRAEIGVAIEPYVLGIDLSAQETATVGFLANGFPDSDVFLSLVAEALAQALPGVETAHWNKGNASIPANDEILGEIEGSCQAVVAAYGH
jgi:hypothetical protein